VILERLELHNFGVYAGKQCLDLAPKPNRPIILVGALNGSGKTTLLEAVQLALYGRRAKFLEYQKIGYHKYLEQSITRAKGIDSASVRVVFSVDGTKDHYSVTRTWALRDQQTNESLQVSLGQNFNQELSDRWAEFVDQFLPNAISDLFFFDGEKVEALAEPKRCSEIIETGLNALLGLNLVANLRKSIGILRKRQYQDRLTGDSLKAFEALNLELKNKDVAIETLIEYLQNLQDELIRNKENLSNTRDEYRRQGGELFDIREQLRTKREKISAELLVVNQELMRLAESELPLAQMLSHLDDLKMRQLLSVSQNEYQAINSGVTRFSQILNEEVQKKQIVQYSLIKEFQQICISIQDDYIKSLKVSPFPSRPDEISSLSEKVRGLKSQANLALARNELKKGELDEADRLIAAVPSEEKLSELQAQLAKLESSQVELAKLANDQTEKLSSLRRAREQIERKIDEVEQLAKEEIAGAKMIEKIDSIVASGGVSLEKFSEAVRTRQVKNLEDLVLDGFRRLLRKHRFIEKVEIDEKTFSVTIFTEKSVAIPAQKLSAGERQLLAVAVLWALARLSGRELPTVIDTPLGRLDSIHRSRFVEQYFPYAARQVVLLSTDEEIVGEHYDALKPFIAHEYTLDFDEDLRSTTINTGYFANLKEAA